MDLALNVLESLKEYYQIALSDRSRNGVTLRKVVLESVSEAAVRESNQLKQLGEFLGARRHLLVEMSKLRSIIEDKQKLVPLVEKLARKAPEGENIISMEWKLRATCFYEQDNISDVVKGHHAVYKVCFLCLSLYFYLQFDSIDYGSN